MVHSQGKVTKSPDWILKSPSGGAAPSGPEIVPLYFRTVDIAPGQTMILQEYTIDLTAAAQ